MSDKLTSLKFELSACEKKIEAMKKTLQSLDTRRSELHHQINILELVKSGQSITGCGKTLYIDEYSAKKHMRELNALIQDENKKIKRTYPCEICNAWHLTSK